MVIDSPYGTSGFPLAPITGVVAGGIASGLMLLPPLLAGTAATRVSEAVLTAAGTYVNGVLHPLGAGVPPLAGGVVFHVALGAMLGLLYAVCQSNRPESGLIAAALSYGFTIWIGSGLVASALGHDLPATVRGSPWLLACLTYGACLGATAIWFQRRGGDQKAMTIPLD